MVFQIQSTMKSMKPISNSKENTKTEKRTSSSLVKWNLIVKGIASSRLSQSKLRLTQKKGKVGGRSVRN